MPLLTELGIFLLGGFLQRYRADGAKTKLTPERRSVTGFEPPPGDSREDYVRFGQRWNGHGLSRLKVGAPPATRASFKP